MKSVLRCQNKPKSVGFSVIDLLIDRKKSKAACGPLKRPKQAFSWLSISQCFDFFQSRKATDGGKRGDVIRWSVFDLPPRFAPNSLFALDFLFIRFFAQLGAAPNFENLLQTLKRLFTRELSSHGFLSAICVGMRRCIERTIFSPSTGNPLFAILKLAFAISLLYVIYRVIKRAITKV